MESFNPNSKANSATKALVKPKAEAQKKFSPKAVNAEINLIAKTIEKVLSSEKEQKHEEACSSVVFLARNLDVSKLNAEGLEVSNMEYVIKTCNKYATYSLEAEEPSQVYDLLEFALELLQVPNKIEEDNLYNLYVTTFNNMAIYSIKMKDDQIARGFFKKSVRSISSKTTSPFLKALIFNNLASFHLIYKEYYKAFKYSEESLIKIETLIFNKIKAGGDKLRGTAKFTSQLSILLIGYYNMGISIKKLISGNSQQGPSNELISQQNAKKFFNNGYKLAQKFLSPDHVLYKKLEEYAKHRSEEVVNLDSSFDDPQTEGAGAYQQQSRQKTKFGEENNDYSDDFDNSIQSGVPQYSGPRGFNNTQQSSASWRNKISRRAQPIYASTLYTNNPNNQHGRPFSAQSQSNLFPRKFEDFEYNPATGGEYTDAPQGNWGGVMSSVQTLRPPNFYGLAENNDGKTRELEDLMREVKNLKDELQKTKKTDEQAGEDNKKALQTPMKAEVANKEQEAKIEALTSIVHNKDRELDELKKTMIRVEEELKKSLLVQGQLQQQQQQQQQQQIQIQQQMTSQQASNHSTTPAFAHPTNNSNLTQAKTASSGTASQPAKAEQSSVPNNLSSIQSKTALASALRAEDTAVKNKMGLGAGGVTDKSNQGGGATPKEEIKKPSAMNFPPLKGENIAMGSSQRTDSVRNSSINSTATATTNAAKPNMNKLSDGKNAEKKPVDKKDDRKALIQKNSKSDRDLDFENFLEMPSPALLLDRPEYVSFPKEGSVRKRIFFEDETYSIECKIVFEGKDRSFRISGLNEQNNRPLREEILSIDFLKVVVGVVAFKDTLPTSQPLKSINNFYQFTKYFILPYIDFDKIEDPESPFDKIIKICPKAFGVFNAPLNRRFMGEDCLVYLHYILNESFRLVISHGTTGETIRLDFTLDQTTIKKFFELVDEKGQRSAYLDDIFKIVETLEGEKGDEESANNLPQIIAKHDPNKHQNYQVENYKVINAQGLVSQLEKLLTDTEIFLRERGFNKFSEVFEYDESFIYIMIKAWSEMEKYRFYMLKENLSKKTFDLFLKNSFETHAPNKEKIKVKGHKEYPFDSLWKDFGLIHEKMDNSDKQALAPMILSHFTLEVHEKELDPDDYERFEENPILPVNFQSAAFFRTYVGDAAKNPITLHLIGLDNIPMGVKVTLFNFEDCIEHGIFFTINEENWLKPGFSKQAKQKRKYNYTIPLEESYFLKYFLNKVGWKMILNNVHIEGNSQHNEIVGRKLLKQYSVTDQLENIITIENLMTLYKNHGDHI